MTFSIVARNPKTLALGVAVSTAVPAVGSVVPHVQTDVGAIATQAQTNTLYGIEGLRLMKNDLSPQKALEMMLIKDKDREKRQIAILDVRGRTAAFTGLETEDWKGHHTGQDHIVAGNILACERVILAMSESFQQEKGSLAERLLKTLEAGQNAGGDKRGCMSAALKVADRRWKNTSRPILDLRVDAHPDPVKELHRVYEASTGYFHVSQ